MAFGPPAMGYDRAITIFSPDGKLYQVEYASEAVRRGWTTIGLKSDKGAVLIAEKKRITPLIDVKSLEKILIIDTHIGATFAGYGADGRVLIDYARQYAMRHRFIYDEPVDVELVVRAICDLKQLYTQHAGVRPFGVSLIFAGVDRKGVSLFKTETNALYFGYYAVAIGSGEQAVTEYLEKNYKHGLDVDELIVLGLKALRTATEEALTPDGVEIGVVSIKDKVFRKLTEKEIAEYLSKAGVSK